MAPGARRAIEDPSNLVLVSAASAWEIAIKTAIGKLNAPSDFEHQLVEHRLEALPVTVRHGLAVEHLPLLHGDPFDRLLVAQAQIEGLTLVTRDPRIEAYDVATLRA